jgi:hypothetical protein
MRAMRRIVTASERAAEDPTLAYTDYVAALESLSAGIEMPDITWDRLDFQKRKILDTALDMLNTSDAEILRAAILKAERTGIKHRYTEFVMSHVRPSFFRDESVGSNAPIRRPSLRRAVASAYDARSKKPARTTRTRYRDLASSWRRTERRTTKQAADAYSRRAQQPRATRGPNLHPARFDSARSSLPMEASSSECHPCAPSVGVLPGHGRRNPPNECGNSRWRIYGPPN